MVFHFSCDEIFKQFLREFEKEYVPQNLVLGVSNFNHGFPQATFLGQIMSVKPA